MRDLITDFAGAQRCFRLRVGEIADIEQACGKIGIGAIYLRVSAHQYFQQDVSNVIKYALIGGGMPSVEAKHLVDGRMDITPLTQMQALAVDILVATFAGIERDDTKPAGDPQVPLDMGKLFQSFVQVGVSPNDVRATDYGDFCNMVRVASGGDVQPPSEEEFADMIRDWEGRQK